MTTYITELVEKYLAMDQYFKFYQHNTFLTNEVKQIDLNNNIIMLNNFLIIEIDKIENVECKNFLDLVLIEFKRMNVEFNKIFKPMYSINYLDKFVYNNVNLFMQMYDDVIDLQNQKKLKFEIFKDTSFEDVTKEIIKNDNTLDPSFAEIKAYHDNIYIYYNWIKLVTAMQEGQKMNTIITIKENDNKKMELLKNSTVAMDALKIDYEITYTRKHLQLLINIDYGYESYNNLINDIHVYNQHYTKYSTAINYILYYIQKEISKIILNKISDGDIIDYLDILQNDGIKLDDTMVYGTIKDIANYISLDALYYISMV